MRAPKQARAHLIPMRIICLLIVLLPSLWGWEATPTTAQSGTVTWSGPVNLSRTPSASAHPAIVTDAYGYVHVFWSEEMGGEPMRPNDHIRNTGNSILYTRWDGTTWSPPIDVLLVPGETIADYPAVDIDAESRLHLVWTSMTSLYYSNAPSWQADSAQDWSEPLLLADNSAATPWGADIVADASGGLHVVYAVRGDQAGVYYTRSVDGGENWQSPIKLSDSLEPLEEHFSTVQIIRDDARNLHAVWGTNQLEGAGQAVYYARSIDGGDTWSVPAQLGYRGPDDFVVGLPYLTAVGASELHLIYVAGRYVGSRGRYHRISTDGGETWSAPYHIITDLVGINGYVEPVVDSAGQMHLIINMRSRDDQVVGIYYARWLGTGWSQVEPVDVSQPSAHYTAVAVRLGNELHVVYTQLAGGEIWHLRGRVTPAKQTSARPWPSPEAPTPTPLTKVTATPPQTPTPTAQRITQPPEGTTPPSSLSVMSNPLLPGVGAALLLVVAVIVWIQIRSRRG